MATAFKNYTTEDVGTSPSTVYTVPALTTSILIGLNLANITAAQIKVDVTINGAYIVKDVPIPSGASLGVIDGKIVAEAGDVVQVTSNTATSCDVVLSCMEQS